jgi:lysophospholipase L1-like esterase
MPVPPRAAWIAVLLSSAALSIITHAQSPKWVVAWSTSQETVASTTISNRTIRMLARVSIARTKVRIRLDNTFNTAPVTIGAAWIGRQLTKRSGDQSSHAATLVAGSNTQLFFNGSSSVVIPAGGSVRSDDRSMTVISHEDLAVSLWVPDTGAHPAAHTSAQVRSFMTTNGAGDVASAESKTAFTTETTSTFWLKSIETLTATAPGAIVAFGDSITDGTCSSLEAHDRWEDWLSARLDATFGATAKAVVNEGIGGNTLTPLRSNPGSDRLERDVFSHAAASDVLLFLGTNDIARGATAAQVIAAMQDTIGRVRARGLRIFGVTILPRADVPPAGSWSSAKTEIRQNVNSWIRTSGTFDGVIDFDAAVRDATNHDVLSRPFNCSDDIHPTPRGYYQMGNAVNLTPLR